MAEESGSGSVEEYVELKRLLKAVEGDAVRLSERCDAAEGEVETLKTELSEMIHDRDIRFKDAENLGADNNRLLEENEQLRTQLEAESTVQALLRDEREQSRSRPWMEVYKDAHAGHTVMNLCRELEQARRECDEAREQADAWSQKALEEELAYRADLRQYPRPVAWLLAAIPPDPTEEWIAVAEERLREHAARQWPGHQVVVCVAKSEDLPETLVPVSVSQWCGDATCVMIAYAFRPVAPPGRQEES